MESSTIFLLNNLEPNFQVWFLEEERLPVVSKVADEQNKHKILMKSPWEILQSPVGSGGVINSLSSSSILDRLAEIGVEYVEVRHSRNTIDVIL